MSYGGQKMTIRSLGTRVTDGCEVVSYHVDSGSQTQVLHMSSKYP